MAINLNDNNNLNTQNQQGQPQPQNVFKPKSSGFTNLNRVLGANKQNQLGSTIQSGVQNISNKTQQQTQGAQQNFAKDIGQAVGDIQAGQKAKENLSNLDFSKENTQQASQLQDTAQQYGQNIQNLQKGYHGPQGLQNADQLQGQAEGLQQTGQGLLSSGGRQAALQRFINAGPNYTQGKQRLDTMLLGQNEDALRQARRSALSAAQETGQAIDTAAQQGLATGQQYGTVNQDLVNSLQKAGQGLQTGLTSRAAEKNAEAQKIEDIRKRLGASKEGEGALTQEDLDFIQNKVLGGSTDVYNMSPDQIATLFTANPTFGMKDVASQSDVASRNALAQMLGKRPEDMLPDLNQLPGQQKRTYSVDNSAYNAQKQAAEEAMKNFHANATYQGGGKTSNGGGFQGGGDTTYDVFGKGNQIDYNTAKRISDLAKQSGFNTNLDYNNRAYMNDQGVTNTLQALKTAGLLNENATSLGNDAPARVIADVLRQINQTNSQYGLGRNLGSLLAKSPDKNPGTSYK